MTIRLLSIIGFSIILSGCTLFRTASEPSAEPETDPDIPEGTVEVGKPGPVSDYDKIITPDAVSEEGMFTVHMVDDKLYFEIPDRELGDEMLLISRIAKAQEGTGYGGVRLNDYVMRWEKRGEKILLRSVLYQSVADTSSSVYRAVRAATFEPIVAAFNIKAVGSDSTTSLIEVTSLFTTDVPEFSPRERYRARSIDSDRSYVERVRSFPDNIEVSNILTMSTERSPLGSNLRSISLMINHSFIRLPEKPMTPRLHDERVGFYSVRQVDYSRPEHRAEQRRYITRWHLEKKDPDAELSEPKNPIVFYVDPGTPEFLVEYVIQGINDWQPAFEQAGF